MKMTHMDCLEYKNWVRTFSFIQVSILFIKEVLTWLILFANTIAWMF